MTSLRLDAYSDRGLKSAYNVWNSERCVGAVWQVFARSFSGAWRASCGDCGAGATRCDRRKDALAWLEHHRGWTA